MPYKNIEITVPNAVNQVAVQTDHFYKGFSTVSSNNKNSSLYDFDLVKQDIINNFNTRKGERLMNPNYGSVIWDLLMEPLTEDVRQILSDDITSICNSDPRVTVTQIDLTEYDQGYLLELTLTLVATDQSSNLKLTFDQNIGLAVSQTTAGVANYLPG
jgi:phage baseplate assembly protein W